MSNQDQNHALNRGRFSLQEATISAGPHPASIPAEKLLADCTEHRLRRSGPGGQNRNKVETAVVLKHEPTGITAEANERRSQSENRRVATQRLRRKLALEVRTARHPDQAPQAPSELWRSRCHAGRIAVNPDHTDFPAILAEALDVLAAHDFDVPAAAAVLNCTASQLTKLLKDEPLAFERLNRERLAQGRSRLR